MAVNTIHTSSDTSYCSTNVHAATVVSFINLKSAPSRNQQSNASSAIAIQISLKQIAERISIIPRQ